MKSNNKKIFIATGGTGGHIFPSLSLAEFLKEKYQVEIITDKRGTRYLNNFEQNNIRIIDSGTIFSKNIIVIFNGFIKVIFSFLVSLFFIIKDRPKLIIGMGGYSSFPICIAGFCLKIPILIYENNLIIGRANKFILPMAKKVLVSTKDIKGISPKYNKKIFYSGYLIRSHILRLKQNKTKNEKNENLSILIMGGSQSARVFGEILPEIMIKCFKNGAKFRIYQQCLENQINEITKIYEKNKLDFELFSFADDMTKYYEKANLAITRSGASSLAELVNLKIPFIAIPLPSSADNHQLKNASYFMEKGYCFMLDQRFLSDKLFQIIMDISKDKKKLSLIKEKMAKHSDMDTNPKIEQLIEKILNE